MQKEHMTCRRAVQISKIFDSLLVRYVIESFFFNCANSLKFHSYKEKNMFNLSVARLGQPDGERSQQVD